MKKTGKSTPAAEPRTLPAQHFGQWLDEHREPILGRCAGAPADRIADDSELPALLRALGDPAIAGQLWDAPSLTIGGAESWHALLHGLRQSIVAELQATVPSDRLVDLLLEADTALATLTGRLIQSTQRQLDQVTHERDQFQSLFTVTHEIATSMDLDRVAQSALNGALKTTRADAGALLILDRESGHLLLRANVGWPIAAVEPELLPEDWTQGWRDAPIRPIGDIAALPPAGWQATLQIPQAITALTTAPIIANGEFYGLLLLGSRQANHFTTENAASIKAIVAQVAGVTENAEIYRLINLQAEELGSMLRNQQEEASKSQAILESIADGVIVNNPQGQVMLVNPAAERILDGARERLIATDLRHLIDVFEEPGRSAALAAIDRILSSPNNIAQPATVRVMLEIGSRVINAHMAPVRTPREEFLGVVTIFRDITKEVEADRAKSEFVSTVSHELRTPMTAIKGYTDLLFGGAVGPLNDSQKHFLSVIKNNTDRLTALINDLLDISRIESGRVRFEPAPVRLGEIVAGVVEAMAARAQQKGLTLSYEVDAGLPEVMGDHDRLYQVLTNLVGNAINYTMEGSVTVEALNVGTAVQVNVRDSGIGIRKEDVGRIFDRFFRSDDPFVQESSGTGLGLPIVKMFVEMHGGRVWVDTELGKGSTFTFILPVPGTQAEPEEISVVRPITAQTILVVDDDPDIAQLVRLLLESNGYRVLIAGRGHQALDILQKGKINLVVLDRLLPDMEGLELLDSLKSTPTTAHIPVIVLTVVEDDGETMARGASAYLTKPINEPLLVEQVEAALSRQGRVLIVEDDPDTIEMLNRALRRVGFSTETAMDGYEALAAARRARPDIILLDLRLPGMDGYEALSHLKRSITTSTIPIVAVSAHVSNPVVERKRLIMLGAVDFLPKPFVIGELIATIDRAIEASRSPSLPLANNNGEPAA
jgi:PAS domain S-box-containing protein